MYTASTGQELLVDYPSIQIMTSVIPVTPTPVTITVNPGESATINASRNRPLSISSGRRHLTASLLEMANDDIMLIIEMRLIHGE